jgi:histone-lysine N-methyltransferase SETMAR
MFVRRLMATVFWDRKELLKVGFMQQQTKITSEVYCETLKVLCGAIQNKRLAMLIFGIVFLHDKAHLHTAAHTWALVEHFNWELFDHPPYSPDLALSNHHLFTVYLPEELVGITALQQ